jgi:hypothetical protein
MRNDVRMTGFTLLIAIAAAAASPPATLRPPPAGLGWLETLAGSCFWGTDGNGGEMRKCFALRDGILTISSSSRSAAGRHRSECLVRARAYSRGRLDFDCTNGLRFAEMVGRYEGELLIMGPVWKARNAPPRDWPDFVWRRVDADRIEIVSDAEVDPTRLFAIRTSALSAIVLTRSAGPE